MLKKRKKLIKKSTKCYNFAEKYRNIEQVFKQIRNRIWKNQFFCAGIGEFVSRIVLF